MNGWTAVFQAVFSVLLLPVQMVLEGIRAPELGPRLTGSARCILGLAAAAPSPCADAWRSVGAWLLCLFLYNAALTALVKRAGAMTMLGTSLMITPVTNLAYSAPWLMGAHVEPIRAADLVGLAVTMGGVVVYRMPRGRTRAKEE